VVGFRKRHHGTLNRKPLNRVNAWQMVQRRAKAAGIEAARSRRRSRWRTITIRARRSFMIAGAMKFRSTRWREFWFEADEEADDAGHIR